MLFLKRYKSNQELKKQKLFDEIKINYLLNRKGREYKMKKIKLPSNSIHHRVRRKKRMKMKITMERLQILLFALFVIGIIIALIFVKL